MDRAGPTEPGTDGLMLGFCPSSSLWRSFRCDRVYPSIHPHPSIHPSIQSLGLQRAREQAQDGECSGMRQKEGCENKQQIFTL